MRHHKWVDVRSRMPVVCVCVSLHESLYNHLNLFILDGAKNLPAFINFEYTEFADKTEYFGPVCAVRHC